MGDPILERHFPNLATSHYSITSPYDANYNCIAWAAEDTSQWWWPEQYYWPRGVERIVSISAFIKAYESLGYTQCADGGHHPGLQKIAIFARDGTPTHAARQTDDGNWTSKCGKLQDLIHALEGLEGDLYGRPVVFMARPV